MDTVQRKKLFESLDSIYAALPDTHKTEFVTIVRKEFLYGEDIVGSWLKTFKKEK